MDTGKDPGLTVGAGNSRCSSFPDALPGRGERWEVAIKRNPSPDVAESRQHPSAAGRGMESAVSVGSAPPTRFSVCREMLRMPTVIDVPFKSPRNGFPQCEVLDLDKSLTAAGHVACSPHRISFFQLLLITGGNGTHWIDSEPHSCRPPFLWTHPLGFDWSIGRLRARIGVRIG